MQDTASTLCHALLLPNQSQQNWTDCICHEILNSTDNELCKNKQDQYETPTFITCR
jgi:hypothetical protein